MVWEGGGTGRVLAQDENQAPIPNGGRIHLNAEERQARQVGVTSGTLIP